MSTALSLLDDGTLASSRIASGIAGIDPRRRRFALNPGIFQAKLHQRATGRQPFRMNVGLVTFRSVPIVDDDFDNALKNGHDRSAKGSTILRDVAAQEFLNNAVTHYGEQGMVELKSIVMLEDPQVNEKGNITKDAFRESAQGYFSAIWPSFVDLGHECPAGLTECVTCRLWLIGDPEKGEGMQDSLIERMEKQPSISIADDLRNEVAKALNVWLDWGNRKWAEVLGEREDRKQGSPGLAKLGPGEHHVRRNLHEIEPSESSTAASFGKEVAESNAAATRELAAAFRENKSGDNSELLKVVIERQNKTDEALATLANAITALVGKKTE